MALPDTLPPKYFGAVMEEVVTFPGALSIFGKAESGKTTAAEMIAFLAAKYDAERAKRGAVRPYAAASVAFLEGWVSEPIVRQAIELQLTTNDEVASKLTDMWTDAGISPIEAAMAAIPSYLDRSPGASLSSLAYRVSTIIPPKAAPIATSHVASTDVHKTGDANGRMLVTSAMAAEKVRGVTTIIGQGRDRLQAIPFASAGEVMTTYADAVKAAEAVKLGGLPVVAAEAVVTAPGLPNRAMVLYHVVSGTDHLFYLIPQEVGSSLPHVVFAPEEKDLVEAIKQVRASAADLMLTHYSADKIVFNADDNDNVDTSSLTGLSKLSTDVVRGVGSFVESTMTKAQATTALRIAEDGDMARVSASNMLAMRKAMEEMDTVSLHCFLASSGLYPYIAIASPALVTTTVVMAKWWGNEVFQNTHLPLLARTEAKSDKGYSVEIYNGSIESEFAEMSIKTHKGEIFSYSPYSMLDLIVGGMLMYHTFHVSTIDLTIVRNLAIKTVTTSGGVDTGLLNVSQYLSDAALKAGAFGVLETRDDFSKDGAAVSDNEGARDIRSKLGANSRFALQIWGTNKGYRNFWLRAKWYHETYDDMSVEIKKVELKDMPRVQVPVKGTKVSFLDHILSIGEEWLRKVINFVRQ